MTSIRGMIEAQVLGLTGMALKEIDFEHPKGEPGLFGPQSAIWQVHGDFTSMLCGGVSALLLHNLLFSDLFCTFFIDRAKHL